MFKIKIADIIIEINNKYKYLEKICRDYIVENGCPDFSIAVTQKNINEERDKENQYFKDDYLESICCYKLICDNILSYNGFLLHGANIAVNNIGYIFIAPSGVGKTTHIKLWQSLLKDKVKIINGDKPIIRLIDNKFYGYGTPWCGKEGYNTNSRVEIKNLCFLYRGITNTLNQIPKNKVFDLIAKQIYFTADDKNTVEILNLVDCLIKKTNAYTLKCNINLDAAKLAYEGMK